MGKFLIGWAEESLVPDKKVELGGQFYERISEYVESDITATAMAIEADGEQAILVSCDLTGLAGGVLNIAREKFAAYNTGVDPMKVIIGATHTHTSIKHTAPNVEKKVETGFGKDILNEFLPADKQYTQLVKADNRDDILDTGEATLFLADKIALAAKNAWENRAEAMYANAFGRAVVGHCRRVCYDDGSAAMWGDTNSANFTNLEGGNDSGIELIYMFDKNKKLTGIVANIACPSQVLEHRSFISADYWGKVKENLRKEYGEDLYLLAMCGAAGDQCPRDMIRWVNPETPINDPNISREHYIERVADPSMFDLSGCRVIGRRVANEIISVLQEVTELKDEAVFKHEAFVMQLPLRKATRAQYNEAVREIQRYVEMNKDKAEFNFADSAAMHVNVGTIKRYRIQQFQETYDTEIHVIRFGDIAIATNPFELFLDYGNRIKARSLAKQTFIMQLTCGDGGGYLPTEKAEQGSHYSAYISSGHVGHEGGDMMVRKDIDVINKMFKE